MTKKGDGFSQRRRERDKVGLNGTTIISFKIRATSSRLECFNQDSSMKMGGWHLREMGAEVTKSGIVDARVYTTQDLSAGGKVKNSLWQG